MLRREGRQHTRLHHLRLGPSPCGGTANVSHSSERDWMKRNGYSLIEALIAMVILLIGISSTLAVFYVSASIQRRAFDDVIAAQEIRNVEAMLTGRGIQADGLPAAMDSSHGPDWDTDGTVVPLPPEVLPYASASPRPAAWQLGDRVYPRFDNASALTRDTYRSELAEVDFTWVPMVRDASPKPDQHKWEVYVFILHRHWSDYPDPNRLDMPNTSKANPMDRWDANSPYRVPRVFGLTGEPVKSGFVTITMPNGSTTTVPTEDHQITNLPHNGHIHTGDRVLLSNGIIGRVLKTTDDSITIDTPHQSLANRIGVWFSCGDSIDSDSPTEQIIQLSEVIR